jgi:hypothetical protein
MINNGSNFKIVVASCTLPDVATPRVFTQVSSHMAPKPVSTAAKVLVASIGKNVLNALTNEIVMAALAHDVAR